MPGKDDWMVHKVVRKGNARIVFFGSPSFIEGEDLDAFAEKMLEEDIEEVSMRRVIDADNLSSIERKRG